MNEERLNISLMLKPWQHNICTLEKYAVGNPLLGCLKISDGVTSIVSRIFDVFLNRCYFEGHLARSDISVPLGTRRWLVGGKRETRVNGEEYKNDEAICHTFIDNRRCFCNCCGSIQPTVRQQRSRDLHRTLRTPSVFQKKASIIVSNVINSYFLFWLKCMARTFYLALQYSTYVSVTKHQTNAEGTRWQHSNDLIFGPRDGLRTRSTQGG